MKNADNADLAGLRGFYPEASVQFFGGRLVHEKCEPQARLAQGQVVVAVGGSGRQIKKYQ